MKHSTEAAKALCFALYSPFTFGIRPPADDCVSFNQAKTNPIKAAETNQKMAAAGEGGERRVFVKKVKDREERVSVPAAHPRFANFEELLDTCMVEYVSFDIVETPDRGFTVVAARDIDKGEVVMYENAVISAVDEEGAQSLLDNYVHYRKSDRAAKCDPYLKFMASDVELSQQDTDALDATYDNYVQKLGGETADVSKEELLHILKVSRANFYDHAIEFEHPATKKPTKVTLTNCYPVIALINHSCDPNVDQSYNIEEVPEPPMTFGSVQMFCEATRKIKKGEEIAISYFDQTELRKRYAERALAIRAARHFDCQCSKCLKEKDKKGGVLGFFGL